MLKVHMEKHLDESSDSPDAANSRWVLNKWMCCSCCSATEFKKFYIIEKINLDLLKQI